MTGGVGIGGGGGVLRYSNTPVDQVSFLKIGKKKWEGETWHYSVHDSLRYICRYREERGEVPSVLQANRKTW